MSHRRLAAYSYLRPVVAGRRVLELGCGSGSGAAHLCDLGASEVVAADRDAGAVVAARAAHGRSGLTFVAGLSAPALQGPFDIVLVPEAAAFLRGQGGVSLSDLFALLAPQGRLVCLVESGDHGGDGLGYYDIVDGLASHCDKVRMFGLTPFAAFGVAEFDEAAAGLRVDATLVDDAAVEPTHYLAIAGPADAVHLGYALVQIPGGEPGADVPSGAPAARVAEPSREADAVASDLRSKLAEAEGRVDGVVRVSRAQAEEIEELRARLRRGAEARAELDDEVTRLRRSLTDADESVMSLTRRTTEEMTALAQQITAGLRGVPVRGVGEASALAEELRRRDAELAARESALGERDERIAALEADRQDLTWRLESAEEKLRESDARARMAASSVASPVASAADRARLEELELALAAREQALVDFRRAASAHLAETAKLRAALGEQANLVEELEESLALAESSAQTVAAESARHRAALAETETADRARRSRLAELEGTLLRLSRQTPAVATAPARDVDRDSDGRAADVSSRLGALEIQLAQATRLRDEAERRWRDAAARILDLENTVAEKTILARDSERDRDEIAARLADVTARADAGRLGAAMEEVARLREALQRSEEQLWDAKSQLLLARERIGSLERELAAARSPVPAAGGESPLEPILVHAFEEMAALEAALRSELAELVAIGIVLSEATREPGPDRSVAAAGERAG